MKNVLRSVLLIVTILLTIVLMLFSTLMIGSVLKTIENWGVLWVFTATFICLYTSLKDTYKSLRKLVNKEEK